MINRYPRFELRSYNDSVKLLHGLYLTGLFINSKSIHFFTQMCRAEISCENLPPFIRVKRTHFKCSDDSSSGLQRNSSNKNSLNSSSCSIASSASSGVSLTDVVERLAQTRIQSGTTMDDSKTVGENVADE